MTAVTNSASCFVRSLRRQRTVHHACYSRAHGPLLFLSTTQPRPSVMTMFQRASATYEAKKKAPQPQVPLSKQLFPSSSQSPRQDANIKNKFQSMKRATSSATQRQVAKPAPALQPRSSNPSHPPKPPSSKAFASLYNSQDSFQHASNCIDLTNDTTADRKITANAPLGVEIFDDDFSDDDNLDLDYELPSALPTLPPAQVAFAKTIPSASSEGNTSTISWSQSSPSKSRPAETTSETAISNRPTKRPFPEGDAPPDQPMAKKRVFPAHIQKSGQSKDEPSLSDTIVTPAGDSKFKDKAPQPWETTPGTLRAQQKKMKDKAKKTNGTTTEATHEDMQQAVMSRVVRQSAISLSNEQDLVKDLVCNNSKSVFFTGPAGTGKSVLMRAIIAQLKKKYVKDPERLAVTASTGLAACNIGGMTLHSFSGIGLGKDDVQTLVRKIRQNPKAKNRWLKTKVLIIDEISMVDGDLFDKLSQIGRTLRNNGRPWGGIQLVITGDFFQLPPVPERGARDAKFAFEAATWNTSIDHTIGLTEVFRQKDPVFAEMLNEMRLGRISDKTVSSFKSLSRPLQFKDGPEVTELFPTRYEVDNSNQRRLRALPGESHRYEAFDSGELSIRDKLLSNMMAPKVLELKKGAQVMLIKNLDETLVNGSLGTVIGFSTEAAFEIKGGDFEHDEVPGEDEVDPLVKQRLAAFRRDLDKSERQKKYPLVQFHAVDGSARVMLCVTESWKVETPKGEVQASRDQLPLILAWALSIHKAQGQTLARVKVDLGKVFEKGQAYVALSRATTQEGLQVLHFDKMKVMAHPRVVTFYQKLYSAETAIKPKKKMVNASITSFTSQMAPKQASKTASKQAPARPPKGFDFEEEEEAMASYGYA